MGEAVDTALVALICRATELLALADAFARHDYPAAARIGLALPPSALPPSVYDALRELGNATVDFALERVQSPRHTCSKCGSSWLGQGECPDADMHLDVGGRRG